MILIKKFIFIFLIGLFTLIHSDGIVIQRVFKAADTETHNHRFSESKIPENIKIAFLSAPALIGNYDQSTYSASLATLISKKGLSFTLDRFTLSSESSESLESALKSIQNGGYNCIIAPLTLMGAKKLAELNPNILTYVPTIHKRELSLNPANVVFGGIDYEAQMQALKPFMAPSLAIFYGDSPVGYRLKTITELLSNKTKSESYVINKEGSNIISHLSRPSAFSKKSIVLHTPVVKSSLIEAHSTFMGIKEHNFLSTQVNMDPALLTLTQYNDRKNMIIANSIIEQSPTIYHYNALYNVDISFDWVNYSTTIGTDMLVSEVMNTPREYSLVIADSQVQYPIELVRPKEFGFEPIAAR